jgi:hypothetical protein
MGCIPNRRSDCRSSGRGFHHSRAVLGARQGDGIESILGCDRMQASQNRLQGVLVVAPARETARAYRLTPLLSARGGNESLAIGEGEDIWMPVHLQGRKQAPKFHLGIGDEVFVAHLVNVLAERGAPMARQSPVLFDPMGDVRRSLIYCVSPNWVSQQDTATSRGSPRQWMIAAFGKARCSQPAIR